MSAVKNATSGRISASNGEATKRTTEAELVAKKGQIKPEDVLGLDRITESYLCDPEDNVYGLDFTRFKIRDMATGATLFEIAKPPGQSSGNIWLPED